MTHARLSPIQPTATELIDDNVLCDHFMASSSAATTAFVDPLYGEEMDRGIVNAAREVCEYAGSPPPADKHLNNCGHHTRMSRT